ncbi:MULTISPECIES: hypothetical protein [Flavobacterium]|uniref:GapS4a family protein n=1 Tax=Flavobacterium TaxID=237 RepID=UPI000914F85D|nr:MULTISPECIES: hypothetical protein [Flavobacterium]MBJ2124331.1 hypothetical protein [Flavobacterium sp. IB48]OXA74261.1 hypothetical protein B0A67_00285 [Flavobacterium aquidurense]SHF90830.1 hypothetical protein SAMN05444481_10158 [Flavobacterium frigidimaris]
MGEWSKTVGEKGEKVVDFFFKDILGYNSVSSNETIGCIKGTKHKSKTAKGDKTTHGIDALISVKSPLEDKLLDIVAISSKYTADEYPKNPKAKFKEHFEDLAFTLECFKNSKLYAETNYKFGGVTRTEITGVLVWLSDKSPKDYELIPKISNVQIDTDLIFDKIIVIDNDRINFLYQTIYRAKEVFGVENVKFVYHNSSLNVIGLNSMSYGDFMPIQYVFSDIIPLRIEKGSDVEFIIFCKDGFSSDNLSKLLSFANSFDHLASAKRTILSFPDYNELHHKSIIESELFKFPKYNFNQNLLVNLYPSDFRNK